MGGERRESLQSIVEIPMRIHGQLFLVDFTIPRKKSDHFVTQFITPMFFIFFLRIPFPQKSPKLSSPLPSSLFNTWFFSMLFIYLQDYVSRPRALIALCMIPVGGVSGKENPY